MNKKIKNYILFSLSVIIICYSLFRLYPILRGPTIEIISPKYGEAVSTSTFEMIGIVKRAKEVKIEDRQILIDQEGNFRQNFVFVYPYTILNISATDSWGRTVNKQLLVTPKE
jgi:hypothetical protein